MDGLAEPRSDLGRRAKEAEPLLRDGEHSAAELAPGAREERLAQLLGREHLLLEIPGFQARARVSTMNVPILDEAQTCPPPAAQQHPHDVRCDGRRLAPQVLVGRAGGGFLDQDAERDLAGVGRVVSAKAMGSDGARDNRNHLLDPESFPLRAWR